MLHQLRIDARQLVLQLLDVDVGILLPAVKESLEPGSTIWLSSSFFSRSL